MAKVKNQSIPTDSFEETLDPPIDFKDQYRRALSEGIDWPKLPAGVEIVTFSKKESRPAQRDKNKYFNKPKAKEHRKAFSDCAWCWHAQLFFDFSVDPCHSAGSRHYLTPWDWIPGARNTAYNKFMQECLDYERDNPGIPFPRCGDINIYPSALFFCPKDEITFSVYNLTYPLTIWATAGTCGPGVKWTAPNTWAGCPSSVTVYFEDSEGRKGCYELKRKAITECCCGEPPDLLISYTTLAMQCGQDQTLIINPASPGCPPYSWSLTGGGSLNVEEGDQVVYSAPLTNDDCSLNPSISVEDNCGTVCTVQLAVNCYTPNDLAFKESVVVAGSGPPNLCSGIMCGPWGAYMYRLLCFYGRGYNRYNCKSIYLGQTWPGTANAKICSPLGGTCPEPCSVYPGLFWNCTTDTEYSESDYCGKVTDVRTPEMKAAGCCPINPETGLPF
jgi:hypothetical protein